MSNITDKVLDKIHKRGMRPAPRWLFMLAEGFKVALFAAAVVAGSLAVSATFSLFTDFEWDPSVVEPNRWALFALRGVPFFWLAVVLAFMTAAALDFSSTNGGYRYRRSSVMAVCLALSLLIGTTLFVSGYGETIDDTAEANLPGYSHLVWRRSDMWSQPQDGLLGGIVEAIRPNPPEMIIRSFDEHLWLVRPDAPVWPATDAELERHMVIRVIGHPAGNDIFVAREIMPWSGHAPRFRAIDPDCHVWPPPPPPNADVKENVWPPRIIRCGTNQHLNSVPPKSPPR